MTRRSAPLLLFFAISCRTPPTPPAPHAPEPVVQKLLRPEPMVFHPELPLVGQEDGERCDVWDLQTGIYRGTVSVEECRAWPPPRAPLAPDLAAATPEETFPDAERRDHTSVGTIVWAASHDGRWIATARRGGEHARVWDAGSHAPVGVIALDGYVAGTSAIDDLMWTRSGRLVLAATGHGPEVWAVLGPERGFERADLRAEDRVERVFADPAGRYLGFVAASYRKPYDLRVGGVIGLSERAPRAILRADRPDTRRRLSWICWAETRPSVYFMESRLSGDLDACGREEHLLGSLDPARGLREIPLHPQRVLTRIEPSPDGRSALIETDDAPPLEPCEPEPPPSQEHGPLSERWDPETGKLHVVHDPPATHAALGAAADAGPPAGSGWIPDPGFFADPSGRWAFAAPEVDAFGEPWRLRRRSDGLTLFFSESYPRQRHTFASDGSFAGPPPDGLAFRLGADVLRAPTVRAAEATFAVSTPDLGESFVRGDRPPRGAPTRKPGDP